MATTKEAAKTPEKAAKQAEEMVTINLFKDDDKYKNDVFVSVNNRTWLIKRGVDVQVPKCVKEVLDNAAKQQNEAKKYKGMYLYK